MASHEIGELRIQFSFLQFSNSSRSFHFLASDYQIFKHETEIRSKQRKNGKKLTKADYQLFAFTYIIRGLLTYSLHEINSRDDITEGGH